MTGRISLQTPALYCDAPSPSTSFHPPASNELLGKWFITYTSLPYWRDKRNITISYTASLHPDASVHPLTDVVTYQTLTSNKVKTVQGSNTPCPDKPGTWDWRGNGWVKVVSNRWETLGHGDHEDGGGWILLYTQKSFFTPAAINLYTRKKEGLPETTQRNWKRRWRRRSMKI